MHALTASGVIVGYVGLNSVIDGPIARKLDVRSRIPTFDGNSLDLIIDYFTCTIVPVAFVNKFGSYLKTPWDRCALLLFVSALWMARTDQETPDGWFNGFPAEWNMIIPSLFLIRADHG